MDALLYGDCLEWLPQIKTGSVDMVFADLPYGVTKNNWDSVIPFAPLWGELLRVAKHNAAFVFTATQPFATALINSQPKLFRYDLIWEKGSRAGGFLNANRMPLRAHELILVFYRKLPTYNPQRTANAVRVADYRKVLGNGGNNYGRFSSDFSGSRNPTGSGFPRSVQRFPAPNNNPKNGRIHPTQKPVALLEWLIKTYSNPGDTILDPVMGSGTTAVAAINTGRHYVGIEKEAEYIELAQRRIAKANGALPRVEQSKQTEEKPLRQLLLFG